MQELITHWEAYQQANADELIGVEHFARWVLSQRNVSTYPDSQAASLIDLSRTASEMARPPVHPTDYLYPDAPARSRAVSAQITLHISRLMRLIRLYTRRVLTPIGIHSVDEFSFLATVYKMGTPNKGELILANLLEISTGTEIIRRLLRDGLVAEEIDTVDKRARRLSITPKGRTVLEQAFVDMEQTVTELMKPMPIEDQEVLLRGVAELDTHLTEAYFLQRPSR